LISHLVARWIAFGDGYELAILYDVFVLDETLHFDPKASERCGSSHTSRHRTFDDVLLNPSTMRARKRSQILARRVARLNRRQLHWRATSHALWTLVLCIEHALILRSDSASHSLWRALTLALAIDREATRLSEVISSGLAPPPSDGRDRKRGTQTSGYRTH
jgi:hypothetical protein